MGGAKRTADEAGLSKADIRRLARKGGVMKMGEGTHEEIREALEAYLRRVIVKSATYTALRNAKTVSAMDIAYALKACGERIA